MPLTPDHLAGPTAGPAATTTPNLEDIDMIKLTNNLTTDLKNYVAQLTQQALNQGYGDELGDFPSYVAEQTTLDQLLAADAWLCDTLGIRFDLRNAQTDNLVATQLPNFVAALATRQALTKSTHMEYTISRQPAAS